MQSDEKQGSSSAGEPRGEKQLSDDSPDRIYPRLSKEKKADALDLLKSMTEQGQLRPKSGD